jgi:ABC transporter substrate binding protein
LTASRRNLRRGNAKACLENPPPGTSFARIVWYSNVANGDGHVAARICWVDRKATLLPLTARAQQATLPVIGFLGAASQEGYGGFVEGFRRGLKETGFVDGDNVSIVYRWAEGQYSRLPELAADLVSRRVSVIMASGGLPSALAAKEATASIPIVFTLGSDPVKSDVTSIGQMAT